MATRKRTNGRFTKTTRRRRSKPKVNLTNLAVSALVANSVTNGLFQSNLMDFFTGNRDGVYRAGSDGSTRLTLPELIGWGSIKAGGNYSAGNDLQSVLTANLKANWVQIAIGVIGIPVVVNTAVKLIRKPIILPANRMLKNIGMDVKV
jgi:hypothetical protein